MQYIGLVGGFLRVSEWVMRLAYINVLWIGFTLIGIVVFGFFPATIAMFTVIRKLVMQEPDIDIFKTFYQSFKKEFFKINIIGYILATAGYILFLDYLFFQSMEHVNLQYFSFVFLILLLFLSVLLLYIFPVYVHYDLKPLQLLKNAVLVAIASPVDTGKMIIGMVIIGFINVHISGFFLFFTGSTIAFLIMWLTYRCFLKFESQSAVSIKK